MSWVPPFFICGECGGEIGRWPMKNLLKQEILDWRHRTVPPGVAEHRAVLGTKAHRPRLSEERLHDETEELAARREGVPLPEVSARPAMYGELPTTAARLDKKASATGWLVEAWFMRGPHLDARWNVTRTSSSVVLRLARVGHRLVACWATDAQDKWGFDFAYSLTREVKPIGSPELNKIVEEPLAICDSCGEPPALHVSTNGGLVCFTEYAAVMAELTEEVQP